MVCVLGWERGWVGGCGGWGGWVGYGPVVVGRGSLCFVLRRLFVGACDAGCSCCCCWCWLAWWLSFCTCVWGGLVVPVCVWVGWVGWWVI